MNYKFEPLNMKEHIGCPRCQKLMIKRIIAMWGIPLPNQEWEWWCNCGNTETGGHIKGVPELEYYKEEWERVNNIRREE